METADTTAGHGPVLCGAKTRGGGTCQKTAGWGTGHKKGRCKLHGGKTPTHIKSVQKSEAQDAVAVFGLPREVDPHDALLEELHRTAGHVAWLGQIISAGRLDAADSPTRKGRTVKLDQQVFGAGDQPSVWVAMYQEERKHLAAVAKTCISVGIEERRVRVAEQYADQIAAFGRALAQALGHDPTAPATREAFRASLRLIEGGQPA